MPKYTHFHDIQLEGYIDGMWKHLRAYLSTGHQSNILTIDGMVRMAQWRLWNSDQDLWKSLGHAIKP
eukprot:3612142-Amphidinium_carterae.1